MKKNPADIIILEKYTKNQDHMPYCSWDMVRERCNCYFSFWAIFCPLNPQQLKNWKFQKMKKSRGDIIISGKCTKNHDHIPYCPWDMVRNGRNYFSFLGHFFCPFTPLTLTAQKIKISKKWKNFLGISLLYTCAPKIMIRWCAVPEIWCATDGRKKWHIEVGTPPEISISILIDIANIHGG